MTVLGERISAAAGVWRSCPEVPAAMARTILSAVGLNPFRQQRRTNADYVMVVVALAVCLALIAWALLG